MTSGCAELAPTSKRTVRVTVINPLAAKLFHFLAEQRYGFLPNLDLLLEPVDRPNQHVPIDLDVVWDRTEAWELVSWGGERGLC